MAYWYNSLVVRKSDIMSAEKFEFRTLREYLSIRGIKLDEEVLRMLDADTLIVDALVANTEASVIREAPSANREKINQEDLLACKYDDVTCDIVVFLSHSGLRQLRTGGSDCLLSFHHEQTGATIEVINNYFPIDSVGGEIQVVCSPDPELLWYRVRISDPAYDRLQLGDIVMDRYGNGMSSKVSVTVDDEMVEMLRKGCSKREQAPVGCTGVPVQEIP